jgi:hypothetical protein
MIALKEFFGLSAKILKAGLKETDSDRRPPPPMLIHQNNPMQSSRRPPACFEKQFDTSGKSAAFLHHSAILQIPLASHQRRAGAIAAQIRNPSLKLLSRRRGERSPARGRTARSPRAAVRESRHEHRSGPHDVNDNSGNRPN